MRGFITHTAAKSPQHVALRWMQECLLDGRLNDESLVKITGCLEVCEMQSGWRFRIRKSRLGLHFWEDRVTPGKGGLPIQKAIEILCPRAPCFRWLFFAHALHGGIPLPVDALQEIAGELKRTTASEMIAERI